MRRWRDSCEQLAVVCAAAEPAPVLARFAELPQIVALSSGTSAARSGVTVEGVPVELVVAEPASFGTALVRATGSADYVAALEPLPDAPGRGGASTRALGVPWCPPELRERAVPRRAARAACELADIRGDLHCAHHLVGRPRERRGDGPRRASSAATSTSRSATTRPPWARSPGSPPDDVRRQAEEIAAANEVLAPFRVLRGIECDILPDGRLDLPDDVLAELDWVQASVHGGQRMPRREMTARVEEALRNPHVSCLSHPKGRYIGRRPENELDLERAFEVALEEGVALEVNGLPDRLDLSGEHVREALAAGVEIVCNTDAHSVRGLGNMQLAVATARRGWATAEQVVNTRPLSRIVARRPG